MRFSIAEQDRKLCHQLVRRRCNVCMPIYCRLVGICTWMPMNNHTKPMIDRSWIRHDDGFRRRCDSSPIWHGSFLFVTVPSIRDNVHGRWNTIKRIIPPYFCILTIYTYLLYFLNFTLFFFFFFTSLHEWKVVESSKLNYLAFTQGSRRTFRRGESLFLRST